MLIRIEKNECAHLLASDFENWKESAFERIRIEFFKRIKCGFAFPYTFGMREDSIDFSILFMAF